MADEKKIGTWENFKEAISRFIGLNINFIYRGQRSSTWKLRTTFHREAADLGITLEDYLNRVLPEVHYQISAYRNELIDLGIPEEFGSFLALLQHHGFPTPLLDWTYSPYIAAYFAFRNVDVKHPQGENIKIFAFDFTKWGETYKQPMNLREVSQPFVSVIRPYAKYNPRLIYQRGIYTMTNIDDMEEHIFRHTKDDIEFLYTIQISVKEKIKVMNDLNLMGINEMSMFSGLDGLCRTLKEQFFTPPVVGKTLSEILKDFADPQTKLFEKDTKE